MFNQAMIWMISIFVFSMVLLLCSLVYSRIHWLVKSGLVLSTLLTFFAAYWGVVSLAGWAVATERIGEIRLLAIDIDEPTPGEPGKIYVWGQPFANEHLSEPRNFVIPYSKELHEKLAKLQARHNDGEDIYIDLSQTGSGDEGDRRSRTLLEGIRGPGLPNKTHE